MKKKFTQAQCEDFKTFIELIKKLPKHLKSMGDAEGQIVQGFGLRNISKSFMGTMTLRTKMCESLEVIGNIHDKSLA